MSDRLITPPATLSFPTLGEKPRVNDQGVAKWSATLVFDPDTDLSDLLAAAEEAGREKFGKDYEKLRKSANFKWPFHSSEDDVKQRYPEGSIYLSAYNSERPGCVFPYADPQTGRAKRMTDADVQEEMYPGARVRASIRFFGFDNKSKGIGVGLNNLQKIGEGPRLDNRVKAENEFEPLEQAPVDMDEDTEEPRPRGKPAVRDRMARVQDLI